MAYCRPYSPQQSETNRQSELKRHPVYLGSTVNVGGLIVVEGEPALLRKAFIMGFIVVVVGWGCMVVVVVVCVVVVVVVSMVVVVVVVES